MDGKLSDNQVSNVKPTNTQNQTSNEKPTNIHIKSNKKGWGYGYGYGV